MAARGNFLIAEQSLVYKRPEVGLSAGGSCHSRPQNLHCRQPVVPLPSRPPCTLTVVDGAVAEVPNTSQHSQAGDTTDHCPNGDLGQLRNAAGHIEMRRSESWAEK